ncbi:NAD(P)/FAD-dependent oxidoreductase [Ornithinimicrobium faecis]|uniref:FAD-dependent oxidoreductase n=1 Tax=Ornithinimicrobium faecis TaxID=2934158 RepID=A0ABY4YWP4_9MICO|nr:MULTISPECIES: FAD-dependent oxidoreductase [unclassified Ornithinimicrobium]USQ80660.1 FAD-dependent oxidoreductase [Ornithinimicrobium sp. HY1793]
MDRLTPQVAVIGAGISGLTAAYALRATHDVTLFEADDRLGGHAHTHDVPTAGGGVVPIDSGFIVHNERTYPTLLRLFRELDVPTRQTEMSMSITCDGCGLSYAGGRGLPGIVGGLGLRGRDDARHAAALLPLLRQVPQFYRAASALLETPASTWDPTLREFLGRHLFSDHFVRHFVVPLVSCVWSAGDLDSAAYPARHLFRFLDHHGMLRVSGSPTWKTVVGGSRAYVDRLAARLPDVRRGCAVRAVTRHEDGVEVTTEDGRRTAYDQVVVATHADQALDLLADADPVEKEALAAYCYSVNHTLLHTDTSVLPAPRARASWNYRMSGCRQDAPGARVSYWMNRLHGLEPSVADHVVTLNAGTDIDPDRVVAEMAYAHPVFTRESVAAAAVLREAGGTHLAFAGAHLGWGFHEDGARSGLAAATRLGARW